MNQQKREVPREKINNNNQETEKKLLCFSLFFLVYILQNLNALHNTNN